MNRETKKYYVLLSGLLFFFFFTWSSSFSLISLWLNQKIGLKGAETGLIFSAISLVALCAQPLYGFIQDKLGLRKHLLQFLGVMLLLTGPFFIYVYAPLLASSLPLGALVGGVFIGATFFAGIGALESYTERVSRISGFEFGRARMWGSLGWASATFLAGFIFNIDPNINFWLASAAAVVFLLLLSQVRELKPNAMAGLAFGKPENLRLQDALALLRMPGFWALVVFVLGISVYNVFDQQFSVYFASQFASREQGNEMYGFLNSLQVFLEAGGMFPGAAAGEPHRRQTGTAAGRWRDGAAHVRLRLGQRRIDDLRHETAARRRVADPADRYLQIHRQPLRQSPLLNALPGGLSVHHPGDGQLPVAAGGLRL